MTSLVPAARACWRRCATRGMKRRSIWFPASDPRYQPLVLPALRHLDYLVINELEAGEFSGLEMRDGSDVLNIAHIADAATQLLAAGVRQRVVIHCPEGAWGEAPGEQGRWIPSWLLEQKDIVGSVGAGDAFCAGFLYGCMNRSRSRRAFILHTPAREPACWPPTRLTARKRWPSCGCLSKRILRPLSRYGKHRWQTRNPAPGWF